MLVVLTRSGVQSETATNLVLNPDDDYVVYGIETQITGRHFYIRHEAAFSFLMSVSSEYFLTLDATTPSSWRTWRGRNGTSIEGPEALGTDPFFVERLADGDSQAAKALTHWMDEAGDFAAEDGLSRMQAFVGELRRSGVSRSDTLRLGDILYAYRKGWARLPELVELANKCVVDEGSSPTLRWLGTLLDPEPQDIADVDRMAQSLSLSGAATHRRTWARLLDSRNIWIRDI